MNSEKVKEIKEALECCKQNEIEETCGYCLVCPASNWDYEKTCTIDLFQKALTLINELESENKELRNVISIANEREYRKKFTDEWRKEYQKELDKQGNGHIAGHPDFDLVYKLYFEQKDRIAELESENERLIAQRNKTYNIWVKDTEKLKDRIAELEKENDELKVDIKNSIDMQKQMLDGFKTTTKEVEENLAREIPNLLKRFTEKLKDKAIRRQEFIGELAIDDIEYVKTQDINETLKEFIK